MRISSLLKKDFSYSKYLRTVERKQKGKQQIVGAEFFVARCIFIGEKNRLEIFLNCTYTSYSCSHYPVCHSVLKQTAWLCLCNFRSVRLFLRNNVNATCEKGPDTGNCTLLYKFLKFLKFCLKI